MGQRMSQFVGLIVVMSIFVADLHHRIKLTSPHIDFIVVINSFYQRLGWFERVLMEIPTTQMQRCADMALSSALCSQIRPRGYLEEISCRVRAPELEKLNSDASIFLIKSYWGSTMTLAPFYDP